jgi:hypothetical protein
MSITEIITNYKKLGSVVFADVRALCIHSVVHSVGSLPSEVEDPG